MSEWAQKRDIMLRYNSTAHCYDRRYFEEQTLKIKAAIEGVNVRKESLILDVGCGTGLLFDYATKRAKTIVGLDISRETLLKAKKRAKKSSKIHLIFADADNMPFKKGVFNHVFSITLMQNMPDPIVTLKEIKRVTKEDAFIVITGLKKKFSNETFNRLLRDANLRVIESRSEGLKSYVTACIKISSQKSN